MGRPALFSSSEHDYIERMQFPFTGTATVTGNLADSRAYGSSPNSSTHGYYICGYFATSARSNIYRVQFPAGASGAQVGAAKSALQFLLSVI